MSKKLDLNKYAGAGTEGLEDIASTMPLLQIIQSGSPEIKRTHEKHSERKIEGAEEGDIVFLPDKTLFKSDVGTTFIPLAFRSLYTEWRNLDAGGGFIGTHPMSISSHPSYKRIDNKEYLGDNELVSTIYLAILFQNQDELVPGILSFTSTQLRKARALSKSITSFRYKENPKIRPPIFACKYRLKTRAESNDKGGWFGWDISLEEVIKDADTLDLANEMMVAAQEELPSPSSQQALPTNSDSDEEEPF